MAVPTRDYCAFCRWADRRTRALFIDFVFFNANTNLFTIVKYVYEVSACGSLIEFHDIDSIRLYTYVGEHGLVLLIMQLLWLLIFMISAVREMIFMVRNSKLYFKESWNWLKLTNILVVCATMVAFALKSVYIQLTVGEVKTNIGTYRNWWYNIMSSFVGWAYTQNVVKLPYLRLPKFFTINTMLCRHW